MDTMDVDQPQKPEDHPRFQTTQKLSMKWTNNSSTEFTLSKTTVSILFISHFEGMQTAKHPLLPFGGESTLAWIDKRDTFEGVKQDGGIIWTDPQGNHFGVNIHVPEDMSVPYYQVMADDGKSPLGSRWLRLVREPSMTYYFDPDIIGFVINVVPKIENTWVTFLGINRYVCTRI